MFCCHRKSEAGESSRKHKHRSRTMLFGMLIGLALGLMFAPKPGSETINALKGMLGNKLPV